MSRTLLTPSKVTLPRFSLRMAPLRQFNHSNTKSHFGLFYESMVVFLVALYTLFFFLLHVNVRSFSPALHTRSLSGSMYYVYTYIPKPFVVYLLLGLCLFSNIGFFVEIVI